VTADEHAEQPRRKPPKLGAYVAALLELAMLAAFAWHRSLAGAAVWVLYFRFSATRSVIEDLFLPDDEP
jgi:hypothetical protein